MRTRFTDEQLVELTASLAWENYRARFDHAFGVESENFTNGEYCALPVRVLQARGAEQVASSQGNS